ncbi:hypothetical protein [Desulfosediminicola sp.]|uniref:baseplate complex protein n=1 Tax=Desulfosediminicola sp. TaxID=2886825 RepID=UPI003AF1E4C1
MELRGEDIAGETSGSDRVEKGIKPKVLTVSVQIPFKEKESLRSLVKKAEEVTGDGEQKIFTVTNNTANAAGIRQVRFTEHIVWDESEDGTQAWTVQFTLQEYMSNPERMEIRLNNNQHLVIKSYSRILEEASKL